MGKIELLFLNEACFYSHGHLLLIAAAEPTHLALELVQLCFQLIHAYSF